MAKTGKIFLIMLLVICFCVFTAAAQEERTREDLREMYMENLRQLGYRPQIDDSDENGDIVFLVERERFYIITSMNVPITSVDTPLFFRIYTGFRPRDNSLTIEDARRFAHDASRSSRLAKVSASTDDLGIVISITAEMLINEPILSNSQEFNLAIDRALTLMANARNVYHRLESGESF